MKRCTKCGEWKDESEFGKKPRNKNGLNCWCKNCCNEQTKKYHAEDPEKWEFVAIRANLKRHGCFCDDDLLADFLSRRPNRCEICGRPVNGNALAVDHDHETGELRGFLCMACNRNLIGQFGDVDLLKRTIWYLETPWRQRLIKTRDFDIRLREPEGP